MKELSFAASAGKQPLIELKHIPCGIRNLKKIYWSNEVNDLGFRQVV